MDVRFTRLVDGTAEEFRHLDDLRERLHGDPADLFFALLENQTWADDGYPVTLMRHGVQTATRALRDGAADDMVVAALFHDIADRQLPGDHAAVAAAMLAPFVSERVRWVVEHHGVFQQPYYAHLPHEARNARLAFAEHPYFADAVRFCERWDQESFDPDHDDEPLEAFRPIVARVIGGAKAP